MEERKRPSPYDQVDSAPPSKKQATSANGAPKSHKDDDMPWKDDLERFQKDAIYRQMQEYKREKSTLESQLKDMRKKSRYHDDHLRIIDSWFQQVIDEVKSLAKGDDDVDMDTASLPSSLLFTDQEQFEEHLRTRSKEIKAVISRLFGPNKSDSSDVTGLQSKISRLLAAEKGHVVELSRLQAEKEDLETRLENASLRYMMAEKKIDRAKSVTVAKLEKQALLGATKPPAEEGGAVKREDSAVNGTIDSSEELADLERELSKTAAISEKQKEQLERLEEENAKLNTQLTELTTKSAILTDEDYAKTELFKQLKSQHEDVIKRINNLEATNTELKEEAKKLRSERTAYQTQLENEARATLQEKESLLAASEANLARIRHNRDELLADQAMKKATMDQDQEASKKVSELASAQEDRIKALESENERLTGQSSAMAVDNAELDSLSVGDLRARYTDLERKYNLLNSELASMSTAYQKTSKIASQKVTEFAAMEEKVLRLSAEKAKADQKFFAAMKSKETRDSEIRTLRLQNSKSAEAVSQLKEVESASRALLATMEKQLADLKDCLTFKTNEHRTIQQQNITQGLEVSRLNTQLTELKNQLTAKDGRLAQTANLCRAAEVEVEELKASLKDTRRNLEQWKSKSGQSEQYEILRQFAYCNICKRALKNTVIKTCGHTFCNECVEERLTSRSRKCPNCGKSFGSNDHMRITL
ncbi:E3 ubiquitin-protein ligase bre1 [Elasticomyces elasticus]|uniref:E3 ubiquitin protein ligase n=1 Tax=Exophiala sideris TaxID=1016849 RepID=A0ABR0J9E8_9EURO|nr:E3 ubiquitin-protein ligase bre1 [Elasticomyces elasticus]KAK5030002.1 E3 ubiquitin-protein ligase bre1 [Exophiala sideris]KAK5031557.1 E3 ubiquitin-protein ligase bre1 [Exophiala sideris]KAK5058234.1 E3 ubiquitin-protein ligase bre1 [Exophiala sideris]KAK5180164.1 E3 ubiquitin-protein ligase bre1 [Eurotiomycetes sp. CCFEE 6388]